MIKKAASICNKMRLPQSVITLASICIKMKLTQFVITLAPIGHKKFPNLYYNFALICNKLLLELVFFAISRVP